MYKSLKLLLLAASEAHEEGSISEEKYIEILDDINNQLGDMDKKRIKEDAKGYLIDIYGI